MRLQTDLSSRYERNTVATAEAIRACINACDHSKDLENRMPLSLGVQRMWRNTFNHLELRKGGCEAYEEGDLFNGVCIIYGATLFLNSLPCLLSLAQMGANIFVAECLHGNEEFKLKISNFFKLFHVPLEVDNLVKHVTEAATWKPIIGIDNGALLRCALSKHHSVLSRMRFVEMTAKGDNEFWSYPEPCAGFLSVNSSPVKLLESAMGTADGFLRHLLGKAVHSRLRIMKYDANFSIERRHTIVVGAGKVGLGIALLICSRSPSTRVTLLEKDCQLRNAARFHLGNRASVPDEHGVATLQSILKREGKCQCIIVTCTGTKYVLSRFYSGIDALVDDYRPLLVNMGFDDEFGDEISPTLDILGLRCPPLPLNFVYSTDEEPPTLDCIFDPVAALLALGTMYMSAIDLVDCGKKIVCVPQILSGCVLSEFEQSLTGQLQSEFEELCKVYPEIQETKSMYDDCIRRNEMFSLHPERRVTIPLNKLDQSISGDVSAIMVYESAVNDFPVDLLQEQLDRVVRGNPWLAGRLVQVEDANDIVLEMPRMDATHLKVILRTEIELNFHLMEEYDSLPSFFSDSGLLVNIENELHGSALFKVSVLPISLRLTGVVLSMNHKIGDGFTFYRICSMLSPEEQVLQLKATRNCKFSSMNKSDSNKFSLGVGGKQVRSILAVRQESIDNAKISERDGVDFLSCNDILTAALVATSDCKHACILANARQRIMGIDENMAGNYICALSLPHQRSETIKPSAVRKAVQSFAPSSYITLGDWLDQFENDICSSRLCMVNNTVSLYRRLDIPGCALRYHLPICTQDWNPGVIALIFRKNNQQIGICLSLRSEEKKRTNQEKPEDTEIYRLDHCP